MWEQSLESLWSLHPKVGMKWSWAAAFSAYFHKMQFGLASLADLPGWLVDGEKQESRIFQGVFLECMEGGEKTWEQ